MKQQLKDLREKLGLRLEDVAKAVKVHKTAVSNWERLLREPDSGYRKAYAKVLKISVQKLGEIVYADMAEVRP
jgi:transcriptional regulator with XRE-family HTH domain